MLVVAANPLNTEPLAVNAELRRIKLALQQIPGMFEVHIAPAAQLEDLRNELLRLKPAFVHFAGHGHEEKGLAFEDDEGNLRFASTEELSALFKLFKKHLRCVFLNCCSSSRHAEAIALHVQYVIAMKAPFEDEMAVRFSTEFYKAIANDESIRFAFNFACSALAGLPDFEVPILVPKLRRRPYPPDPEQPEPARPEPPVYPVRGIQPATPRLELHQLATLLLKSPDVTLFLGPESASEGRKGGKPYPTIEDLAQQILKDHGGAAEGLTDPKAEFREVLRRWPKGAAFRDLLSDYLVGEPGPAHHFLVALALSLFPQCRLLLFLTTGFDNLLQDAFASLQGGDFRSRVHVIPISSRIDDAELQRSLGAVSAKVNRGEPVIIKLFGDLDADSPLLSYRAKISDYLRARLQDWFQRPSIFIGYGFNERELVDLFLETKDRGPAFVVYSGEIPSRVRKADDVYLIPAHFGEFARALMDILGSRDNERELMKKMDDLLRRLDPRALYREPESIAARAAIVSRASLARVEERLPRSEAGGTLRVLVPIVRTDTQPDISDFFQDHRPLLAVVGDSGSGKSTLFYQIHKAAETFISVFYDIHQIQEKGSLAATLARDLLCEERDLEELLKEIDKVLARSSLRLLILVDGLNESRDLEPSTVRFGIENLALKLPSSIKIAYSCRKIYWDNFIVNVSQLNAELYHGSHEFLLRRFSAREAESAFQVYQDLYRFRGSYTALSAEFKQRITDPLMLWMLAEGYQERELPAFAPAVLIFETFEKRFRKEWKDTVVPEFLSALVESKVHEAQTGRPSDQFIARAIYTHPELGALVRLQEAKKQRGKNPLVLLEDEGILMATDEERSAYRFAYDRFFEYLLGKAMSPFLTAGHQGSFLDNLRQQIHALAPLHFSFLQALKSEVIRLNIQKPAGPWSLYRSEVLRSLLNEADPEVAHFTKDLLRELMFEGREDLLPVIEGIYTEPARNHLLMLDIAPDSARTLPLVAKGLTGGTRELARRCCHILVHFLSDPEYCTTVEEFLLAELRPEPLDSKRLHAFFYYSAALVGEADRRQGDPVPAICDIWRRVWQLVGNSERAARRMTDALVTLVRGEGGRFFDEKDSERAFDYIWNDMSPEIKSLAHKMVPFIIDPEMKLTGELREILLFFGSKIKYWSARNNPSRLVEFDYKLEFTMAQWILVQRARGDYQEVKEILNKFVATGYSLSIEVALSNMQYCCLYALRDKPADLKDAYQTMLSWLPRYKEDEEGFYWSLDEEDPLSLNECPIDTIGELALLDEFSPKEEPVPFLEEWITSKDPRDRRHAIICARKIWRIQPVKILRTLALIAKSDDDTERSWLDRILREIYIVHPRLVEDFFWRTKLDALRVNEIKHRSDIVDPSAIVHPIEPLCKVLFLGPRERLAKFGRWYVRLLESSDLESFCEDLVPDLLAEIIGETE